MNFDLEGYEQSLCLKYIKDISQVNMNILITAIKEPSKRVIILNKIELLVL